MNEELTILKNIVRIGEVSSVDLENRTARVKFTDKNNLVSGPLKIIKNRAALTIEKEVDGEKWDLTKEYSEAEEPGVIALEKTIQYEKKESILESTGSCTYTGVIDEKTHKHIVKVHSWVPHIGELVLCIYMPNGGSDGFVIGAI